MTRPEITYADLTLNALVRVRHEVEQAREKFGSFASAHEGYAVLLEEVDELWLAIKANDAQGQKEEAIQVAAMAVAFIVEICGLDLDGDGITRRGAVRHEVVV